MQLHKLRRLFRLHRALVLVYSAVWVMQAVPALAQTLPQAWAEWLEAAPEGYFTTPLDEIVQLLQTGKGKQALNKLRSTAKNSRAVPPEKLLLLKGFSFEALGKNEEALKAFKNSLRYRGSNSDTLFFLSQTRIVSGDSVGAKDSLNEALWFQKHTIVPRSAIQIALADLYTRSGDIQQAQILLAAAAQGSDKAHALIELSKLARRKGERSEALLKAEAALQAEPDNHAARLVKAQALLMPGASPAGQADSKRAAELVRPLLQPEVQGDAMERAARLVNLQALVRMGEYKAAEQEANDLLKRFPADDEIIRAARQLEVEKTAAQSVSASQEAKELKRGRIGGKAD